MAAAAQRRALLVCLSTALFGAVFAAYVTLEKPGLGVAHFFYLAIALLAFASGPWIGAAGGILATVLYAIGIVINPRINSHDAFTVAMGIRGFIFVSMGALIGVFARTNRRLFDELQVLAKRDALTGLPNTRAFESAITRRLDAGVPFAVLLGDLDALMVVNRELGHAHGNDILRALADSLRSSIGPQDEIARVGGDEFAILTDAATSDEAARMAARLEALTSRESPVTFGWASFPHDGENALSLFRAADERLYARKLIRGRRLGDDAAQLPVTAPKG